MTAIRRATADDMAAAGRLLHDFLIAVSVSVPAACATPSRLETLATWLAGKLSCWPETNCSVENVSPGKRRCACVVAPV